MATTRNDPLAELHDRVLAQLCASSRPPCTSHAAEAEAVMEVVRDWMHEYTPSVFDQMLLSRAWAEEMCR